MKAIIAAVIVAAALSITIFYVSQPTGHVVDIVPDQSTPPQARTFDRTVVFGNVTVERGIIARKDLNQSA